MIVIKKLLIVGLIALFILIVITNNKTQKQETNIWSKIDYYNKQNINRYKNYKNQNKDKSLEQIVTEVNIGIDMPFYTQVRPSKYENSNYVLVNKYHYLNRNYIPKELVDVDNTKLNKRAAIEFNNMKKAAADEGFNIVAISGYRSYDYQKNLYNSYIAKDTIKNVDTYSARAGHSEHQTGLAVDISNGITSYDSFENTKEFNWIIENAHKYGFILRYPKEKEYITGYIYEAWHYRYVGLDISLYIKKHNITFEEYYVRFIENKLSR